MDITLTPIRGQGNETNWRRCADQLRAAGASDKDLRKFAYEFGYHNMEGTRTGRAIESAAEACGYDVEWINEDTEEES